MAGTPATHSPVQFTFLGTTKQSNWQNWQKRSSSKKNCEDQKPLLILVSLCLRHCWLWISQSQILRPAGTEMNKMGNLLTNFLQVLNSCSLCYPLTLQYTGMTVDLNGLLIMIAAIIQTITLCRTCGLIDKAFIIILIMINVVNY